MNSCYVSGKFYSWKSDADLSRQLKKPSTYACIGMMYIGIVHYAVYLEHYVMFL